MKGMLRVLAAFGLLVGLAATAAPVVAAQVYWNVWVSNDSPAQNTSVTVYVSRCNDYDCYSPSYGTGPTGGGTSLDPSGR